ncbi:hypothetical protein BP5796_00713 [Coleophoma crateriformis]|uniref:Cytochrome b561 domain-containing protein n=1 Tax=Coleophoma crateriformis TaxID=565419 RepID=A0A3D8T8S0_9HELO|nr:hypothetical protein BP5796_00713 [Coleophoma crateriformis]
MAFTQNETSLAWSFTRYGMLILVALFLFTAGLFSGRNSYNGAVQVVRPRSLDEASTINELNAIIAAHNEHLRQRDEEAQLASRSLFSALGDALQSGASSVESSISSLLPNASSLIGSLTAGINTTSLIDSLEPPANSLGVGLASGAMTALKLQIENKTAPSGIAGVAQSLGSGLTSTIFSSANITALLNSPPALSANSTVGLAALSLAQGLGGGAVSGLNINKVDMVMFNTSGLNGVVGNFGQGLAASALGSVNIKSLTSGLGSIASNMRKRATETNSTLGLGSLSNINIADIAGGFGTGLGQGAAIGLGFQADASAPSNDSSPAVVSQVFAKGLVASFLSNGTLTKAAASFTASTGNSSSSLDGNDTTASSTSSFGGISLGNINIASAAEGLAVGLVSGAASQVMSLRLISADTTSFNDTVGGAATSFGRGLGSEGAKLVSQILGTSTVATPMKHKRSLAETAGFVSFSGKSLTKREDTANATDLASVLSNLNASNINPLVQTGLNALTCEGVGGLAGIFVGLILGGTVDVNKLKFSGNLTLPDQDFFIRSGGNTYALNPSKGLTTATVNNTAIISYVILAVLHIVLAILAYFIMLPLVMLAFSCQRITKLMQSANGTTAPLPKWIVLVGYAILPLSLTVFILGIAFRASAKHFATVHAVIGLIVFFQTIAAGVTTKMLYPPMSTSPPAYPNQNLAKAHKANVGLLLLISTITLLSGFADLSSVSVCITNVVPSVVWMTLSLLSLTPIVLAAGSEALKWWLSKAPKSNTAIKSQISIVRDEKTDLKDTYGIV